MSKTFFYFLKTILIIYPESKFYDYFSKNKQKTVFKFGIFRRALLNGNGKFPSPNSGNGNGTNVREIPVPSPDFGISVGRSGQIVNPTFVLAKYHGLTTL